MSKTTLAIEWSSTRLSVAYSSGSQIREEVLELKRFQAEQALPFLEEISDRIEPPSELRIGRGPGNYSGIRQALSWAFGYVAPGSVDLKVFSSGVAQAHRLSSSLEGPFAVLGDARRGVWWGQLFGGKEPGDWQLNSPEVWAEELKTIPVFSQEAIRLKGAAFPVTEDFPKASDLLGMPDATLSEEALPLYLHPAV